MLEVDKQVDMENNVCTTLYRCFRRSHHIFNLVLTILLLLNFMQFNNHYIMEQQKEDTKYYKIVKRNLKSFQDAESYHPRTAQKVGKGHAHGGKYTFATLLCDDRLLEATSVLVYSLINYAKTKYPVTVMALPRLSKGARDQLHMLGAKIVSVTMLEYPFKLTVPRLEQNKPCRYSKLQLWNMTQFNKIVYMDSDMMVLQNIDSIFDKYDEFSAVADAYPGIFNTGIFVLKPDTTTYNRLIDTYKTVDSYNVGDQGYLNWFFGAKWKSNTSLHLPLVYNVLIKYKDSVIWPTIKDDIKVVHFTAETKPWNIHFSKHVAWRHNSDPVLYYKWMSTRRIINHIMNKHPKYEKVNAITQQKCEAEIQLITKNKFNLDKRFPIEDKFTVVLSTFDRVELALKLIHHYSKSKIVYHIFVIWHNPREEPPKIMTFLAEQKRNPPVTIIK